MLVGNILEKAKAEQAWHICADKLADRVRDIWLAKTAQGVARWEETFAEDSAALPGLREEGFGALVGVDYIFKYWGSTDEDAVAGEITVVWKIIRDDGSGIDCYRSWVRLTDFDFILGLQKEERDKREANRAAFREAFAAWLKLFETI